MPSDRMTIYLILLIAVISGEPVIVGPDGKGILFSHVLEILLGFGLLALVFVGVIMPADTAWDELRLGDRRKAKKYAAIALGTTLAISGEMVLVNTL